MQLPALFNRLLAANQVDSLDWFDLVDLQCCVEAACLKAARYGISEPAVPLDVRAMLQCVGRLLARLDAVEPDGPLTIKQAAARLAVSVDKVYDLCKSQRLKHKRIGRSIRVHSADLDSFMADSTRAPASRGLRCLR
jgi:excisionase family DNA binding protein